MSQQASLHVTQSGLAGTLLAGRPTDGPLSWFADGLARTLMKHGHTLVALESDNPRFVINFTDAERPRPFRRKSQGTFVVSVVAVDTHPENVLTAAYPILVRSLSNLLVYLVRKPENRWQTYFITLEQGYYTIASNEEAAYFEAVYERMAPLANSQLVVNNQFTTDLPEALWNGDEHTRALRWAGQLLDQMNLLPAAFPIAELLPAREMAHVKKLFNLGGLSYGNLSVRRDPSTFWMSASGVNKGNMQIIGRDMLLITGYDARAKAMRVSVPAHVEPRRASVDAIEHWMIYTEHPQVGAIIHVHAWMEGIPSTRVNYPCGTAELASEVAELVRQQPDPSLAIIGLRNHGLTITGRSLADIMERISGRLLPQVPMS